MYIGISLRSMSYMILHYWDVCKGQFEIWSTEISILSRMLASGGILGYKRKKWLK